MTIDDYIQFAIALTGVLALMLIFALIMKKMNILQANLANRQGRLKIIEQKMIDPRTKVALIQCDDAQHLVILSQNGNTVITTGITPPKDEKDMNVDPF